MVFDKIMPRAAVPFFFIKSFSTFAFAVLYSSLVLYITKNLHGSVSLATGIIGVFIAFNFLLHLFGGYIGGRFLSYRALFVLGILLEFTGTLFIAQSSMSVFYIGLSIFLTGCGLYVTSINCILTQQFKPEDSEREKAFFWVYSGMNVGFFLGMSTAGYYHIAQNYHTLFIISATTSIISLLLFIANWSRMADIDTPLMKYARAEQRSRLLLSIGLTLCLIPLLWLMLQHSAVSKNLVLVFGACMLAVVLRIALGQKLQQQRNSLIAFFMLLIAAIVFWSLFFVAPMGMVVFIKYHVSDKLLGFKFPPQWFANVNTLVIVFCGPLLATLFQRLRNKGINITVAVQFTIALLLMAAAYLILPLAIKMSPGKVSGEWIVAFYALQSSGELFISPVGYAMVGQLVPTKLQGIMMGTWMMISGIASSLAHSFSSSMIEQSATGKPAIAPFVHSFNKLGMTVIGCAIILMLLTPMLNKLMGQSSKEQLVGVGV